MMAERGPIDRHYRVLLIDANEDARVLIEAFLAHSRHGAFSLDWVDGFEEGLAALVGGRHDVALVDYRLGPRDGLQLIEAARSAGTAVPLIVLMPQGSADVDSAAIRAGAADYLDKSGLSTALLERTIRHAVERAQAAEAQKRLEQHVIDSHRMESVGRLAGGIAHEFNNLLTAILGYSELLSARVRGDLVAQEELAEIQKAGERAAALTRRLLAFGRRQVLQATVVDLNELVAGMLEMLRGLLGEEVDLRTRFDPGPCLTKADRGQLEQVLVELAVNAREAMPGGGTFLIETGVAQAHPISLAAGSYVTLTVRDSGHGMDEQARARAFEPFFTTKEPGAGTGLGLAMVYGVVKQSGGEMTLASERGFGARFTVYLPRIEAPQPAVSSHEGAAAARGGETILLVDDEDTVRGLVRSVLQRHGYQVLEAAAPAEALRIASEHPGGIDLLLTDMVMPQMSGRDVAAALTRATPALKVLYMSGYFDPALLRPGELGPGGRFLCKPFTPDELVDRVREVLDAPVTGSLTG